MEYLHADDGAAIVALTPADIGLLLSMIGETLEAVEDFELQTRTGYHRHEITAYRDTLREIRSTVFEEFPDTRRELIEGSGGSAGG